MTQTQLINTIRETMIATEAHDAILKVIVGAIPVLLVLWIINRNRHPQRSFLSAVAIFLAGFLAAPTLSYTATVLWIRTGGNSLQALAVGLGLFILTFWLTRLWVRSTPRVGRSTQTATLPVAPATAAPDLPGEVAALRAEVVRLQAKRQGADSRPTIH